MAFCVSVSCRDDVFLCALHTFGMKILICVVCFSDPVIFSFVFCIYRRMVWAICGLIFAHFGEYCGSFCVCARVCEYSIAYDYLFLRHCSGAFAGISRLFFDVRRHFGRIFRRFASMRRLSRLARARISRVPDVGFGGGDGFACGLCRRSRIFRDFAAAECAVFPARACDPNLFVRPRGLPFGAFGRGWRSGLILRWDRLPGRADREIFAVSGKIGRNFTGKFLKMF